MSYEPQGSRPHDHAPGRRSDSRTERQHAEEETGTDEARRALHERACQLGATASELEAALETLAMQAEAVLHRLRGGRMH